VTIQQGSQEIVLDAEILIATEAIGRTPATVMLHCTISNESSISGEKDEGALIMGFRNEFFTPRHIPERIRGRHSPQADCCRCAWQDRARISNAPRIARELAIRV
jgi:hypothetical protein